MKTHIVPIGNSRGVRIPKTLLELCHICDTVNLSVKGETITIRPVKRHPRAGWEAAFQKIHQQGGDRLLIPERLDLDLGDWEW
jgi:antitoxin MazE